jgi:hypothetical protein
MNLPTVTTQQILKEVTLVQVAGQWTVMYKRREYMRLLDATSREDAEQQLKETLLVAKRMKDGLAGSTKSL